MKILALGGSGQQGRSSVRALLRFDEVAAVTVADIDIAAAQCFCEELAAEHIRALELDVTDEAVLKRTMAEHDVVLNCVGPFYRFAEAVVSSAIGAGVNYVDICDDTAPTIKLLDDYDEQAKEAGVGMLIGMGASPGLLNVIARHGANQLDRVENIRLYWNVSVNDVDEVEGDDPAIFQHAVELIAGDVVQFLDGQFQRVEGGSGQVTVDLPHLGEQLAYYVSHPEPATIPRYIDASNVTNQGGCLGLDEILLGLKSLGLANHNTLSIKGQDFEAADVAVAVLANLATNSEPIPTDLVPACSDMLAMIEGSLDGRDTCYRYSVEVDGQMPTMGPITGGAAAVGVLMMGLGEIERLGVFAPEGGVDPEKFFSRMEKLGIRVKET